MCVKDPAAVEPPEFTIVRDKFAQGWRRDDCESHFLHVRRSGRTLAQQNRHDEAKVRDAIATVYANGNPIRQPSYSSEHPDAQHPLHPVRALQKDAILADVGVALRDAAARLGGKDELTIALAREESIMLLKSIGVQAAARLVDAAFGGATRLDDSGGAGHVLMLSDVEPWPVAVDGVALLNDVADVFRKYVSLPDGAADTLALWTAHAHIFDAFVCSPRLNVSSPEKGCGKTTLRDVLALLVPRPLPTENLSVAVLFRVIEAARPTLLVDECDAWINDNEELRGLLNAGHRRGGQALRCVGEQNEVRAFNVYGPAVLCGIGALPGTVHDRSIIVRLERAKPGEQFTRYDTRHTEHESDLCRKLARWATDYREVLSTCDPAMPERAFNRLADNWRPLFAVASVIGGDWPARATAAFNANVSKADRNANGYGVMLLTDVQRAFAESGRDKIFSKALVQMLCAMTDRPWPEAHRGHPITATWLARKLHGFGISTSTIRINAERLNGYTLADFADAFARYVPEEGESKRDSVTTPDSIGENSDF